MRDFLADGTERTPVLRLRAAEVVPAPLNHNVARVTRILLHFGRHILGRSGMLDAFLSPKRDQYLETWVRSRAFAPPAML
jgi:hypothetical protein